MPTVMFRVSVKVAGILKWQSNLPWHMLPSAMKELHRDYRGAVVTAELA